MAYNGSGTFSRLYNWVTDRNNGVKVRADRMDAEFDGIATGLSNVICRDGQSTVAADIPFNAKKITNLGDATSGGDALNRQTADARYLRNASLLTNITDLADSDEFIVSDASDSASNKAVAWSALKAELLSEMTTGFLPSGTSMLFVQTAAPTGWTKSTTHSNKALRVVSGTASSGGTLTFTGCFSDARNIVGSVGATSLTEAQLASHDHVIPIRTAETSVSGFGATVLVHPTAGFSNGSVNESTNAAGSGNTHTHSLNMNTLNLDVQYVDVIIATKD